MRRLQHNYQLDERKCLKHEGILGQHGFLCVCFILSQSFQLKRKIHHLKNAQPAAQNSPKLTLWVQTSVRCSLVQDQVQLEALTLRASFSGKKCVFILQEIINIGTPLRHQSHRIFIIVVTFGHKFNFLCK